MCVLCKCMSVCSGEVDCESSLVTHKASAIKAADFNTLSYSENTQMDTHTHTHPPSHTYMFNVTPFGFLLTWTFVFVPPPPSYTHIRMCILVSHTDTHTHTHAENELRADSTICGAGSGSRRQVKRNQSGPAQYSMSPTSYLSSCTSSNNKAQKDFVHSDKIKNRFQYFTNV